MRNKQARRQPLFFLRSQLGLGRAAALALFNEGSHFGVGRCSVRCQRMLRRHRAKGHADDGVSACGEHIHATVADQRSICTFDLMRKRKTHAFGLANPVLLHQTHFVRPAV